MLIILPVGGRVWAAQEPPTTPETELSKLDARIKLFLEGVSADDAQTAYQELLVGSQLLKQKALQELIDKTIELKNYGKCHGFEQIAVKSIGMDLVLLKYLYKCEDFPIVWYFSFYRTPPPAAAPAENTTWRVVTVRFDTELELLWF